MTPEGREKGEGGVEGLNVLFVVVSSPVLVFLSCSHTPHTAPKYSPQSLHHAK